MKTKALIFAFAAIIFFLFSCEKEKVETDRITFEEFDLGSKGYYIGEDMAGGFRSGNALFKTSYDPEWESWSGFAISNHSDTETRGYQNQYSCISGSGAGGSENFALLYTWASDTIEFIIPEKITGISFSNSTWAYYAMLEGDLFSKQFGGDSGDDSDYFNLNIKAIDEAGHMSLNATLNLADYRFTNNAEDYIANAWTEVDLSDAGFVKYLVLSFESSDTGDFGINTPTYVCIDNIRGELKE